MKTLPVLNAVLLTAALSACGGGGSGSPVPSPTPETPQPSPVGSPIGAPVTATIGAAGGTLNLPGGAVKIEIPAGALSADQAVGIQEISNTAPGQAGRAYRLTPEGTIFARPVNLTFTFADEETLGSAPQALSLAYQDHHGIWQMYRKPVLDLAAKTVTVQTTHFSDWSKVEGVQLLPLTAKVKVGQSVALKVVHCAESGNPDDDLVPMPGGETNECGSAIAALTARNWSVNGAVGGSAATGTVAPNGGKADGTAIYTAPAKKPARNPVAVTVQVSDPELGALTLVSNVTVEEPLPSGWSGSIHYHEEGTVSKPPSQPMTGHVDNSFVYDEVQVIEKVVSSSPPETTLLALSSTATSQTREVGYTRQESDQCKLGYTTEHWWEHLGTLNGQETIERYLTLFDDGTYQLDFDPIGANGVRKSTHRAKVTAICPPPDPSYDKSDTSENPIYTSGQQVFLKGQIDPKQPDRLSGTLHLNNDQGEVPTTITITWNLTRRP